MLSGIVSDIETNIIGLVDGGKWVFKSNQKIMFDSLYFHFLCFSIDCSIYN